MQVTSKAALNKSLVINTKERKTEKSWPSGRIQCIEYNMVP